MLIPLLLLCMTTPQLHPPAPSISVAVDSSRHTVELSAGPFMVPAGNPNSSHQMEHTSGSGVPLLTFSWPVDGWLRGVRLAIYDENGQTLPRRMVHHIDVVNYGRRQLFYSAPERILALGQETEDISLPKSVGVPVSANTRMGLVLMWHNESPEMLHGVTIKLTLDWSPTNLYPRPLSVLPVYMNVINPVGRPASFDLPPGPQQFSAEFKMPLAGRVIAAGAHLHEFGREVQLDELRGGEKKTLIELKAESADGEHLTGVERSYPGIRGKGIKLKKDGTYEMSGTYYNTSGDTLKAGAMIHLVLLFAPENLNKWPEINPADPAYQRDLKWLSASGRMSEER